MNNATPEIEAVEQVEAHLVDDEAIFFAPASTDAIDALVAEHNDARARIEALAAAMLSQDNRFAMSYFLRANGEHRGFAPDVGEMFNVRRALDALTSSSWEKALALTNVRDLMPQARRTEWDELLVAWKQPAYQRGELPAKSLPPFDEATVRASIRHMEGQRMTYFAERVDGVFRALSGRHVTNQPQGFSKRMILEYVLDKDTHFVNFTRAGYINDLRACLGRIAGRDEPAHHVTSDTIKQIVASGRIGQWVTLDAGALRLRVFKVGTCHLEVAPEMAWRLNGVLASLYPMAIPASFRQRPAKPSKEFRLFGRPLPFGVLSMLDQGSIRCAEDDEGCVYSFAYDASKKKDVHELACTVLSSLGGVEQRRDVFAFDYKLAPVLQAVLETGQLPDDRSYQFYPTPRTVGTLAADMAGVHEDDGTFTYLEPSAGRGDLADLLPRERTHCVEISALRCAVLRARGYDVSQDDFIAYASREAAAGRRFDKVLANPPYSEGRALAHLQAAAGLVAPGGRLSFVLPASLRGKDLLPGWRSEWSHTLTDEFAGTGVSVAIYAASAPDRT